MGKLNEFLGIDRPMTQEDSDQIAYLMRDEYRKHLKGLPSDWTKRDDDEWRSRPDDWAWLNKGEDK